ncbi:MAG: hypothetical protein ACO3C1_00895 [Ilumatobacteraceae bacterium]
MKTRFSTLTRGRRRLVVAAAVALATTPLLVGGASAYPDTSYYGSVLDVQGMDDVPGQKDLTQQGWKASATQVDVYFNFDDVVTKGGNTLGGCTLFDSNDNGLANFAMCAVTGAADSTTPQSSTLYSCKDVRADRCANGAVLSGSARSAETTCGYLNKAATPAFVLDADPDTRVYCTIKLADVGAASASLLNTCAYSSAEPNSDPADCVAAPAKARPSATGTDWVYPNATITVTGFATGGLVTDTVTFSLYDTADCSNTALQSWTLNTAASVSTANTTFALTVDGTYYWKVESTGNDLNNPFSISCGTIRTIVDL